MRKGVVLEVDEGNRGVGDGGRPTRRFRRMLWRARRGRAREDGPWDGDWEDNAEAAERAIESV